MPSNAQILAPQRAKVWLAPVGTAAPADAVIAPAAAWRNVGLTKEDSLQFAVTPEFEDVTSHQSEFPTRVIPTTQAATMGVDLQQWNAENLKAAFGGGAVTAITGVTPAQYKFTPPQLGARVELSAMIEVVDGSKNYRWVFGRVFQREGVESQLSKGSDARLPLRFSVLGDDGVDPWYLITNDPAFAPV